MRLSDIVLTEASNEKFDKTDRFWYPGRGTRWQGSSVEVVCPLSFYCYEELLRSFLRIESAFEVSVIENGTPALFPAQEMTNQDIETILKIVDKSSAKMGHVELHFDHHYDSRKQVSMRFAEIGYKIVGYDVLFPFQDCREFRWETVPRIISRKVRALWEPPLLQKLRFISEEDNVKELEKAAKYENFPQK